MYNLSRLALTKIVVGRVDLKKGSGARGRRGTSAARRDTDDIVSGGGISVIIRGLLFPLAELKVRSGGPWNGEAHLAPVQHGHSWPIIAMIPKIEKTEHR